MEGETCATEAGALKVLVGKNSSFVRLTSVDSLWQDIKKMNELINELANVQVETKTVDRLGKKNKLGALKIGKSICSYIPSYLKINETLGYQG